MLSPISALALSIALACGAPAPISEAPAPTVQAVSPFEQDTEQAWTDFQSVAHIFASDFRVTYMHTRNDGVKPIVNADMLTIEDATNPGHWHIFKVQWRATLTA